MSTVEQKIFLGDRWVDKKNATVSVYDHGILYGDGIYEGIRAYGGKIFKAKEHLKRLERSAKATGISLRMSQADLLSVIEDGLEVNNVSNAYIRLIITRGSGRIGPDPSTCDEPLLIIIVEDIPPLHGKEKTGIKTALATVRRSAVDSATAQIKSLNYMSSVMGKMEATRMKVDDVIMLNDKGFVAEAPVANIFLVRDSIVTTPSKSNGILEGITRNTIIELLGNKGHAVVETDVTPFDLTIADELFLCGTHAEIVPILEHNGLPVGDGNVGAITAIVLELFKNEIKCMGNRKNE